MIGASPNDVYTDDSAVCTAAVHSGAVNVEVVVEVRPGREAHPGSTRNGIRTQSWGTWGGSYVFVLP